MDTFNNNNSLLDAINDLENTARIPALRAVAHSTMAKCIGEIRQHIRNLKRHNEDAPETSLDERNAIDENERFTDELETAFGRDEKVSPLKRASVLHAVYSWCDVGLRTLIQSDWDAPLSLKQMLEFMTKNAPRLDPELAKALAVAAQTNVKTIEKMYELQTMREREQLVEVTPEIVFTFNGFGDNGYEEAINELPAITRHQLGIKVVESLYKARDQVLNRVLRTRRIADLASVPLLEDAAAQIRKWVEAFETQHASEIHEAVETGRFIRSLEDVTPENV